jgi:hypothetical protein
LSCLQFSQAELILAQLDRRNEPEGVVMKRLVRTHRVCGNGHRNRGAQVLARIIYLIGIIAVSLMVSGCTACGQLDKFNAPTLPKLCRANNPPT